MVHQFKNNGYDIVLDVNSGAIHVVDDVTYDVISMFEEHTPDEIVQQLKDQYPEAEIKEAIDEVEQLKQNEELFTEDVYKSHILDFKKRPTVVKALCLHIAHDCNLACKYCFAEEGEYHGRRALMSYETGKQALDFLIANSGSRKNLEVDFFGGEPLMNFDVVKQLVAYGREQEKLHDKHFRFTLTTNGVLLNDEVMEFANKEMDNVVLSIDGRKEVHDRMRPFRKGAGSYDLIVPKFQKVAENGFYAPTDNVDWTTGFWTGEIWLSYEDTGKDIYKKAGEIQIDSFLNRIENKIEVDHHDMGFLYSPSCVAGYKLTGNETGRKAAILAADQLIRRFHPVGNFIQAWGAMDAPENYRLIIDCLLNLPLLYWASEETGDPKYRDIAEKHIHTAVANVIREDHSTWHTFFFDMKTGAPDHGATCQGYRDGSAWARGQAWGIYGMALAYKYTEREEYIQKFRDVTDFFLAHLPKDMVPFWDLEFTDGDDQPRDSSSASIAACGMLEMAKYLKPDEAEAYRATAKRLMKALYDGYAVKDPKESNGLVLHSTYSNHSPYNTCNHYGVDECNIWGDYFYMEALMRLKKDWNPYW